MYLPRFSVHKDTVCQITVLPLMFATIGHHLAPLAAVMDCHSAQKSSSFPSWWQHRKQQLLPA
jgi:hypothetical protein